MLLITQSLLSSWARIYNAWEGGEEQAMADFRQTLLREKPPPNDAMLAGLEFERKVYELAANSERVIVCPEWRNGAVAIANIIRDGQFQVTVKRPITIGDDDYLVYGVLDAIRGGIIYDVKFKTKSFGSLDLPGYYLDSAQHPAYMYMVPEALEFQYLVSDGEDLYIERYPRDETKDVGEIIAEFIDSIRSLGLYEIYAQHWQAR